MRSVGSTGADWIVSLISPHCVHLIRANKQATCNVQGYAKCCSLLGLAILLCYHTEKAHNTHQCKSKNAICEVTKRGQNASRCSPMFDAMTILILSRSVRTHTKQSQNQQHASHTAQPSLVTLMNHLLVPCARLRSLRP